MKIGYYDDNMPSSMYPLYQFAKEQGIHIQDFDQLSYLGTKDEEDGDPFDVDTLLVNPTLDRKQWEDLLESVKQHQQIKFIFFLTPASAENFEEGNFDQFANVESYISPIDWNKRFDLLLKEAKQS